MFFKIYTDEYKHKVTCYNPVTVYNTENKEKSENTVNHRTFQDAHHFIFDV